MTENIHHTIEGAYQYNAYHHGICFQKSWHQLKFHFANALINATENDVILDAACGSGVLTGLMSSDDKVTIKGIDFNASAIQFCNKTYKKDNTSFEVMNLNEMLFSNDSFNKISFLEVLEHLPINDAKKILNQFYLLLNDNGYIVLSTPNKNSLWPFIEFVLDILKLTPAMKGEQHVKLYNKKELTALLRLIGFNKVEVYKTHFLAPWLSFLGLKFAEKIFKIEQKIKWLPGSLLFVVAKK